MVRSMNAPTNQSPIRLNTNVSAFEVHEHRRQRLPELAVQHPGPQRQVGLEQRADLAHHRVEQVDHRLDDHQRLDGRGQPLGDRPSPGRGGGAPPRRQITHEAILARRSRAAHSVRERRVAAPPSGLPADCCCRTGCPWRRIRSAGRDCRRSPGRRDRRGRPGRCPRRRGTAAAASASPAGLARRARRPESRPGSPYPSGRAGGRWPPAPWPGRWRRARPAPGSSFPLPGCRHRSRARTGPRPATANCPISSR